MAARFAGSRFLDERRRRRLASENEEAGVDPECFAASAACASHVVEKPTARALTVPVLPLRKLVSGRYWKLMLLGCLLFLVVGAVVWSGEQLRVDPDRWGPGVAGILELGVGA